MISDEAECKVAALHESTQQPMSNSKILRRVVVAFLGVKAIIQVGAAVLILATQHGGKLLGRSLSGTTAMALGDIMLGIFYVMFACAVVLRWRRFALPAIPILIVDLFLASNWGAPLILLVLLAVPSTRRKLWS